jgi:hydrogenase maturation protease
LDILGNVEGAILVDAVRSSASAGSIHRLDQDQILAFGKGADITHGWGVAETLALARKLNLAVSHTVIKLIGIEAAQVELGAGLSLEIEQAIPAACEAIEMEVQQFLR